MVCIRPAIGSTGPGRVIRNWSLSQLARYLLGYGRLVIPKSDPFRSNILAYHSCDDGLRVWGKLKLRLITGIDRRVFGHCPAEVAPSFLVLPYMPQMHELEIPLRLSVVVTLVLPFLNTI